MKWNRTFMIMSVVPILQKFNCFLTSFGSCSASFSTSSKHPYSSVCFSSLLKQQTSYHPLPPLASGKTLINQIPLFHQLSKRIPQSWCKHLYLPVKSISCCCEHQTPLLWPLLMTMNFTPTSSGYASTSPIVCFPSAVARERGGGCWKWTSLNHVF